jgi:hypothetical protein
VSLTWTDLVVRGDGTIVELQDAISTRDEIKAFFKLFKDWRMVALLYIYPPLSLCGQG